MNTKIILSGGILLASSFLHPETPELAGIWKTIDDKTRYTRADAFITTQKNGIYQWKIIKIYSIPNPAAIDHCEKCKGALNNAPMIDLPSLSGFKQNPKNRDEFIDGHISDSLSGHVYQGKGRFNTCGNMLTLLGFI
ncbi:DUF2147 domain-containing protein [Acinetobacter sp.]|uniref:DUF2147 domain-containing protein n=1 Tax=Acinetobacter sp. TaxID=472 RepID=UPI00388F63A2